MSDENVAAITDAIVENATAGIKSMAVEGENIVNLTPAEQAAGLKVIADQAAVNGSYGGMRSVRRSFPGASGLH